MANCKSDTCGIQEKDPAVQEKENNLKETLSKIKHKFLIMSGKGGVGKTSVAVNLGIALGNKGYKVGIMDVDLHGPDVPRMLGLEGMAVACEGGNKLAPMKYSENVTAMSIECVMPNKDEAVIWRGPLKHSAITQFISDVDWGILIF